MVKRAISVLLLTRTANGLRGGRAARPGAPDMHSRLVALSDLSACDELAWRELAGRAAEPNPFFEPDCLLAAGRHLPGASAIHLAIAEEAGRFFACMPIDPARRWGRLPVRTLQARAECTAVALATPLIDPSRGVEAATALLGELHDRRRETRRGLLVLDWLGDDGDVAGTMKRAAAGMGLDHRRLSVWERPVMRRRDGLDGYWMAAVGKGRRRTIGQHQRGLAGEIGGLTLVDRGGDPTAPGEFLRLEASGWKSSAPEGQALANREDTAAFFADLCARFAASGRLSLLSLEGDGRSAAMLCCLRAGDGLFAYRVGHDDALRRHGPGIQMFVAAMGHLDRQTDASFLDSCTTPDNGYLSDLLPDRRRLSETVIVLGGRLDRTVVTAVPAIRHAKRTLTTTAAGATRRRETPNDDRRAPSRWLDRAERCQFEQSPHRRAMPLRWARDPGVGPPGPRREPERSGRPRRPIPVPPGRLGPGEGARGDTRHPRRKRPLPGAVFHRRPVDLLRADLPGGDGRAAHARRR